MLLVFTDGEELKNNLIFSVGRDSITLFFHPIKGKSLRDGWLLPLAQQPKNNLIHKESFSLCSFTIEEDRASHAQKVESDYKQILKYLDFLRTIYGNDANFVCGYEAGCLGFTLYHQLTDHNVNCVILAPITMLQQRGKKRIKTDIRDAALIGRCLAQHNYSPVHVPTPQNEKNKKYI